MLGRRKTNGATVAPPVEQPEVRPAGKGRPTPRRSEAQAANRRPLVVTDRKAAARASRERMRVERGRMRTALQTGDERNLPARDKGPARRYARDFVDARWNVGEFILFAALALVVVTLTRVPMVVFVGTMLLWVLVLATVIDCFVLNRQLKKRLAERFGDAVPPGIGRYAVMRALQLRRSRLPKPQVKHGQWPA